MIIKMKPYIYGFLLAVVVWCISPHNDVRSTEILLAMLVGFLYGRGG